MSSPSRRHRPRALRPMPEALEGRQLLARMVSGTDIDGDTWVLKLIGPGDLRVTTQNDASGNPVALTSPSLIDSITVAGGSPLQTRLIGKVTKGANGDGKVFFQNLTEIGGLNITGTTGSGILSTDIPNFWLGFTDPNAALSATNTPSIDIPDGIVSLRFGGVDTTAFFGSNSANNPAQNNQADQYSVSLGLPAELGTSIIVDKVISNAQAGVASGTTPATPTQDGVTFDVTGRINLFQANEINGNTAFPSSGFQGGGGTLVVSVPSTTNGISGAIGAVRVLGNATNFAAQTNTRVQDFYVGGETNQVSLLAVNNVRKAAFGRGMDNVQILAHSIGNLTANRGALNSNVTTNREIFHARFGGNVVDTNLLSGYQLNLTSIFTNQTAPTAFPNAQTGGAMNVAIAGSVTDSIFAASVQPVVNGTTPTFGSSQDLFFPRGQINARVEGVIDNAVATPDQPTKAFYAKSVKLTRGPVVPPNVVEQPAPAPPIPARSFGLFGNGTRKGLAQQS